MLWLQFSKGRCDFGSFSLTSHPDLCSPCLLPHCGMLMYVGADFISVSFVKVLFCLVVDTVSVTSGQAQSSASHPGHYLLPHPVPQSLCQKRTPVGFDGPFSLMHDCVLKLMQLNGLFWRPGFEDWGFLFTVYCCSHSAPLLLCKSPHLKFASLPLLTLQNPQKQANSGLGAGLTLW